MPTLPVKWAFDWVNTHSPNKVTKENHLSLTDLENYWKWPTETSHVHRYWFYTFQNIFLYILYILHYCTYLCIQVSNKEYPGDSTWGHIKVLGGECHSVCLEPPFLSSKWWLIRAFTSAFHSEWLPPLRWPSACADFPTKCRYDINGVSSGDVPMMWGFWMMTFTSQLGQHWEV